jgi:hypothetical protein
MPVPAGPKKDRDFASNLSTNHKKCQQIAPPLAALARGGGWRLTAAGHCVTIPILPAVHKLTTSGEFSAAPALLPAPVLTLWRSAA